jgi:DNA-directed RNA polymerase specialized sigma24 family protein
MESKELIMISRDNLAELAGAIAKEVRQKEWLTEKEAAEYLDVKVQTIRNYCFDGLLEYSEIKKPDANRMSTRMVRYQSLIKLLESKKI